MNISDSNPVYIDISPDDVRDITAQAWDTLRILVVDERLCIATGYGNTHSSMVYHLKRYLQDKRVQGDDSIMYFEGKTAYINDTCFGSGDRLPARKWGKIFTEEQVDMLKLLAEERGLTLT